MKTTTLLFFALALSLVSTSVLARERVNLNNALDASYEEKAEVTRDYRKVRRRPQVNSNQPARKISIEVGDEFAASQSGSEQSLSFRHPAVSEESTHDTYSVDEELEVAEKAAQAEKPEKSQKSEKSKAPEKSEKAGQVEQVAASVKSEPSGK